MKLLENLNQIIYGVKDVKLRSMLTGFYNELKEYMLVKEKYIKELEKENNFLKKELRNIYKKEQRMSEELSKR
jgi:uncharacterized membrane protein (DUF106 family)